MSSNLLARETSPYLLQHAANPVHWMPWGPEALQRARTEGKPILLSVGYAACHWCHVMAHESFEDEAIAALMNELFVCVKVDREERPDIDTIYQQALALLGQQGGWPLTMFLTPDGEPFWGGTYFPSTSRYGRPGFPDVLRTIAETYRREPDKVARNVTALREALEQLAANQGAGAIQPEILDRIAERLAQEVDPVWGGIGSAPKFPQVPILHLLWRAYKRTGHIPYGQAVGLTLLRMCEGGIYDHLGGGFHRYSTDAEWLVPHFEKMLYDNAQLIELLTLVWQETREPLFAQRVAETAGWVLRDMVAEGGGFASTLDADSEGEEGRFYVWDEAEIDRLLGSDAALFKQVYDVTPGGNWEGHTILNRRRTPGLGDPDTEARLAACRQILLAERSKRARPGWDDKVLADWNGLMIAALTEAAMVFERPDWLAAAQRAFDFVRQRMVVDGRLRLSWRNGTPKHVATLDGYANMARAALALFEATGAADLPDQARQWLAVADRHYWDATRGGYFFTADDAEALIVRTKNAHDGAIPSGNGLMVGVLARLFYLTGEDAWYQRAVTLTTAFSGEISRNFFPLATSLNNVEFLHSVLQVVIIGDRAAPETHALARAVLDRSLPNRLLTIVAPDAALPPNHSAAGKTMVDDRPTAYLCYGMTCQAPLTAPDALTAALDGQ